MQEKPPFLMWIPVLRDGMELWSLSVVYVLNFLSCEEGWLRKG